jgi:hypothetical protein
MPATADRVKVANLPAVAVAQHGELKPYTPGSWELRAYAGVDALTGKVRLSANAE